MAGMCVCVRGGGETEQDHRMPPPDSVGVGGCVAMSARPSQHVVGVDLKSDNQPHSLGGRHPHHPVALLL